MYWTLVICYPCYNNMIADRVQKKKDIETIITVRRILRWNLYKVRTFKKLHRWSGKKMIYFEQNSTVEFIIIVVKAQK